MTSARAALVLPLVLVLGACAARAGAGTPPPTTPPAPTTLAEWSQRSGIAPELAYVTDLDGFELATQSVGVVGDDGMSAAYVRDEEAVATVLLTTSREPSSAPPCDGLGDDPGDPGGGAGGALACAVVRDGVHVLLEGDGVDATTLRAAADGVRAPRADELAHLFQDVPVPGPPVERGDLPAEGDGAPRDTSGAGG